MALTAFLNVTITLGASSAAQFLCEKTLVKTEKTLISPSFFDTFTIFEKREKIQVFLYFYKNDELIIREKNQIKIKNNYDSENTYFIENYYTFEKRWLRWFYIDFNRNSPEEIIILPKDKIIKSY